MAGFKVMSVDWQMEYQQGKVPEKKTDVLLDLNQWPSETLYFGVFATISKINDNTEILNFPVTLLNDTPRSLMNTLASPDFAKGQRSI